MLLEETNEIANSIKHLCNWEKYRNVLIVVNKVSHSGEKNGEILQPHIVTSVTM